MAQEQKPDLWLLAVGINDYPDNPYTIDLNLSVPDARAIRDLFKSQEGKAFHNVNTLLIADTEQVKPTGSSIISGMDFLKNAKPNDVVILYFALSSIAQDGAYYLLPSDLKVDLNGAIVTSSLLDFADIARRFTMPGKKILFIDTDASEHAVEALRNSQTAVLAACLREEHAYENYLYGGGLFTYSITSAFRDSAAIINGKITLASLAGFVPDQVRQISRNKQHPVVYIPDALKDLVLGVAD
jgi:uncharacterized caspase-like protein